MTRDIRTLMGNQSHVHFEPERRPGWPRRHTRLLAGFTTTLVALIVLVLVVVGWIGSRAAMYPEATVPEYSLADYDFAARTEAVRFPSRDGTMLAGWFVPVERPGQPVIILLHGYGPSKWELLPHAAYLRRAGYKTSYSSIFAAGARARARR